MIKEFWESHTVHNQQGAYLDVVIERPHLGTETHPPIWMIEVAIVHN